MQRRSETYSGDGVLECGRRYRRVTSTHSYGLEVADVFSTEVACI